MCDFNMNPVNSGISYVLSVNFFQPGCKWNAFRQTASDLVISSPLSSAEKTHLSEIV